MFQDYRSREEERDGMLMVVQNERNELARAVNRHVGRIVGLADALLRYGQHEDGCPGGRTCSCGLNDLLRSEGRVIK